MWEKKDLLKKVLIVLAIAAGLWLAYYILPKAIVVFLPFILAYLISSVMRPMMKLLNQKLRLPKRLAACVSTFLVIFVIGSLIYYLSFRAVLYIQHVLEDWDSIRMYWVNVFDGVHDKLNGFYTNASPDVQNILDGAYESFLAGLQSLLSPIVNAVIKFATEFAIQLPTAIIFTVVMFLATYFMLAEDELIVGVFKKIFGEKIVMRTGEIYKDMMKALGGYVKAQLSIMAIVSIPLIIGMKLAGVEHFVLIAILIAIFDALPIFGSGAILVPWAIYGVVAGEYFTSIVMVILYLTVIVVRQVLEPKIVGKHIGVPPIFTLISIYAGLKIFGVIGMVLGPVCVLIVKNLYTSGAFDFILSKTKGMGDKIASTEKNTHEQKGDSDGQ